MKKISLLLLCACVCSVLFASNDTIRILGIGNSFTVDAMDQHLQPIFTGEDQPVVLVYPYRGGTLLSQHDMWKERTDTFPYNHYEFRDGLSKRSGDQSANLLQCVQEEPWDYIVFQTNHSDVGRLKSYDPYLSNLISFVKTKCSNKDVQLYLYMTWAYDSVSNYSAFGQYGKNTNTMYDSIRNAVSTVMKRHPELKLIPVGTAIQNGRTSYMGHRFNRDGYHLNYDHGRYIASLTWVCSLLGYDPDSVSYAPSTISEYCARMCRAAVKGALATPYDTTSLRAEFGKSESESQPADESRLQRVTFNGLNIPIVEGVYEYTVPVNAALGSKVTMYSFPISAKAEQNIVDEYTSDVARDPEKYGYFPLNAPALGQTVTYTNHVIAEDLIHTTTYVFHMVGVNVSDMMYTIGSKQDLEDFAAAVNSGQYGLNAKVTNDVILNMQKQECWKTPIGTYDHPYTGTFDGQGYTLSGFNIFASGDEELYAMKALGLFGAIKDATIKNLTLTTMDECYFDRSDKYTINNEYCGVLCGWMSGSTISNCRLIASVFTNVECACGAICGFEYSADGKQSIIDRCCVEGAWRVRYKSNYGAFIGYAYNVIISNSYSLATLELQTDHSGTLGGFIGYMNPNSDRHISFRNCYFAGKVSDERIAYGKTTKNTIYLGAIVGRCKGTNAVFDNVHYLQNCAPGAFGLAEGSAASAVISTFAKASLTDGTLCAQLGGAFTQGKKYPVIAEQEPGLVERFSKYNASGWTGSADPEAIKNGDVCDWLVYHARRKSTDIVATGARATWFAKTGDGYIKTKDAVEGGVKSLSFLWNKYEVDTADLQLTVTLGEEADTVNQAKVPGNPRQATDLEYIHTFTTKANAVLTIANTGKKVVEVSDITIVPYLRYTNKDITLNIRDYASKAYKFTNAQLIDNTDGEGDIVYSVLGENMDDIASIDPATGEVTLKSGGDVTVQAAWNDAQVTTTYQLHILEPYILETFRAYKDSAWTKSPADTVLRQGDYFTWVVSCARHGMQDTLVNGARATWFNATNYGFIRSQDTIQGGIKRISFKWNKASKGERTSALEIAAGDYKDTLQQKVTTAAGVYMNASDLQYDHLFMIQKNVPLSFAQIANNCHLLVGDIAITPYLYYTTKLDSVELPQISYDCTSSHLLINNTNGEGEVVYDILSDPTGQAMIENGVLNLSDVTYNGDIVVKASWNEGQVFTTFTLRLTGGLVPTSVAEVNQAKQAGVSKVLKNNHLLIIRDQHMYNIIGQQYK